MEQPNGPLRTALQNVLLTKMIRCVPSNESNWKALIVDRAALRILAATMHLNELVNEGISIIELLDIRREPLPSVPAIYFLTPTAETVEQLASESPSQYKSFRIFFTTHLPDFLLSVVKRKAKFIRRVKCFIELDVRFLALESRVFSLDRPAASLPQVHAADNSSDKMRDEIAAVSDRLAEVCKLVAPAVQWDVRSDATSFTTRTLASLVNEELRDAMKARKATSDDGTPEEPEREGSPSPGSLNASDSVRRHPPKKATLLIVDRASDVATPLVHEFTYQAMAHDLLPLNYRKPGGAHIEVDDEKSGGKKFVQLDDEDKDPIWGSIRWLFIQEALQKAQEAFRHFVENDAAFKIRGKTTNELDIKEMSAAVRALPQSQMKADKHAMHIHAARACLEQVNSGSLTQLALLEQDLIVGRAPDGTKLKSEEMVEQVLNALQNESFPIAHRARLLMLALIVSEGLPGLGGEASQLSSSATFRGRMRRSGFESMLDLNLELQTAVDGVKRMLQVATDGFTRLQLKVNPSLVESGDSISSKIMHKYAARQAHKRAKRDTKARHMRHGLTSDNELHYDVARYHPPLRSVMMDLVDGELDHVAFPSTGAFSIEAIIASLGASSTDRFALESGNDADDGSSSSTVTPTSREWSSGRAVLSKAFRRGDMGSRSSDDSTSEDFNLQQRTADPDHLYVVFVLGGVTYSEVRAMYEVCAKRGANVVIGGSDMITPTSFIQQLAAVADPVVRVQAMLPPLPLDLAVVRAQKKDATAATLANGFTPSVASGSRAGARDPEEMDDEFHRERKNVEVVEVVTSYKKKGFKVFGKKWKQ